MTEKNIHPPGVVFYTDFYDALKDLPEETVGKLVMALMRYVLFDEAPDFDPMLMTAWTFLRSYADRDKKRYAETVERRRAAAEKRWRGEQAKSKEKSTPEPAPRPLPPKPPKEEDDEPPASPEWLRENILSGKFGAFSEGLARRLYPELAEKV